MKTERFDKYHKHGCHFYGNLVVVDYTEDWQNDPRYGQFGAMTIFDYVEKATKLVTDKYGKVEILLSIPELVCRIPESKAEAK